MNTTLIFRACAMAAGLALLSGCGVKQQVNRELDQARHEVMSKSITLHANDKDVPVAQITPHSDLLIGQRRVRLTAYQHTLVRRYRQQTVHIALEGIEVGRQGADIGLHAAWPAAMMALFGASDDSIERHVRKKLVPIHLAAAKLCDALPALMSTEQQLAASLNAFRPYATLTPEKIDHCRTDALDSIDVTRVRDRQD